MRKLNLIAHRGYPHAFPENTLLGYQQAVMHGARYVELDVQCTHDLVPVLYHDMNTKRLSGIKGSILQRTFDEVEKLDAYYPRRFKDRFLGTPISTLRGFANWLVSHPEVTAFVEIKNDSLAKFGIEAVMTQVMQALKIVKQQCVIISFNDQCLEYVKQEYSQPIGWVLKQWDHDHEVRARSLSLTFYSSTKLFYPPISTPFGVAPGIGQCM